MIKWAELIPTMCGWAVGIEGEGDEVKPCLYDTQNEVIEEIEEMHDLYHEQIEAGERDEEDDEYEGECHAVRWDGENLLIAATDERVDWRAQL